MTNSKTGGTHTQKAVFALREKILSGEYAAGKRLREVALAEDLNVSRPPVRDAMSRLAEEGLLERADTGGFIVRGFGYNDIADSIELRGILEGTVARFAAERGVSKVKLNKLDKLVLAMDKCFAPDKFEVDRALYAELNADFHREFGLLSGSEVIERELSRVMLMPFASPSAFLTNNREVRDYYLSLCVAQQQHRDILVAIAKGQGARAEAIARDHAHLAMESLGRKLAENPLKFAGIRGKDDYQKRTN